MSGNIATVVLQSLQACACSCPIHQSVVIIPCDQGSDRIPNYYILLGLIAFLAVNLSVHCPVVYYRKRCYSKTEERRSTEKIHLIDIKKKNTERTVQFTVLQFSYTAIQWRSQYWQSWRKGMKRKGKTSFDNFLTLYLVSSSDIKLGEDQSYQRNIDNYGKEIIILTV